jgi:hypothetical protein
MKTGRDRRDHQTAERQDEQLTGGLRDPIRHLGRELAGVDPTRGEGEEQEHRSHDVRHSG